MDGTLLSLLLLAAAAFLAVDLVCFAWLREEPRPVRAVARRPVQVHRPGQRTW
jgi:hypothetical protein